ncbi:MAG: GNAT family N-acetyltransferase [Bacteroidetes bacterium GWF2_42_66]|nr:MAG: GNAT family N-acetyltransferase [Bacteroidetes bacterium GWE2_42_39]OFY40357.1 MAG: GNAT family N-acetyltransferase [Bacteroidetes bacterium GWF2_42_66]HBL73719.1 GNAT family N-acetyltransferase [Prolixibacteraceae bacterium]HCU61440.1 GNAT family N-acetyltransferase [Prolixibacteraceae bacterium]
MQIREAQPADAEAIVRFQIEMAKETESIELDRPTVEKGVAAVFADREKGTYYVADDNGKVVASLLTTYEWSDWRNGTVLWVQSVYVLAEYRRKGVFSAIYQHVKSKVLNDNSLKGIRLYVEQNNSRAQAVYERSGMTAEHYQMYEWLK